MIQFERQDESLVTFRLEARARKIGKIRPRNRRYPAFYLFLNPLIAFIHSASQCDGTITQFWSSRDSGVMFSALKKNSWELLLSSSLDW